MADEDPAAGVPSPTTGFPGGTVPFPIIHRILKLGAPPKRYQPVGCCIYCGRAPPVVRLTDEHIIADGLGGDLLLPSSSCLACAKHTGRVEQLVLRDLLRQPRGAMGIRSRKKRPKQTGIKMRIGPDDAFVEKEISFISGMPPILVLFVTDQPPGICRDAVPNGPWSARLYAVTPSDVQERWDTSVGPIDLRFGFNLHADLVGQMIAKIAHAFAVAALGIGHFIPFLRTYICAKGAPFDGYHIASEANPYLSDAIHEIALYPSWVPNFTPIGTSWRRVYVTRIRLFSILGGPEFCAVVGEPKSTAERTIGS
jgi:HNH endonuclease